MEGLCLLPISNIIISVLLVAIGSSQYLSDNL